MSGTQTISQEFKSSCSQRSQPVALGYKSCNDGHRPEYPVPLHRLPQDPVTRELLTPPQIPPLSWRMSSSVTCTQNDHAYRISCSYSLSRSADVAVASKSAIKTSEVLHWRTPRTLLGPRSKVVLPICKLMLNMIRAAPSQPARKLRLRQATTMHHLRLKVALLIDHLANPICLKNYSLKTRRKRRQIPPLFSLKKQEKTYSKQKEELLRIKLSTCVVVFRKPS